MANRQIEVFDVKFSSAIRFDTELKLASLIDITLDIISTPTKKYASEIIKRISKIHPQLGFSYHKFAGRGRYTPVVTECQYHAFVPLLIAHSRMSSLRANEVKEQLGLEHLMVVAATAEYETIDVIEAAFVNFGPIRQFAVADYRIDLYLTRLDIAIECDESNHQGYNRDAEKLRTDTISAIKKCVWVRYNPHKTGFNVGEVISRILAVPMRVSVSVAPSIVN